MAEPYVTPRARLHRAFGTRTATDVAVWQMRCWSRAVLMSPSHAPADVAALLSAEWAAYRAAHPGEPAVTWTPPAGEVAEDEVVPGAPPYHENAPLRFGRYGVDLPTHEERLRDEQERLARRDVAYYGF